ncbi:hypothetical protein [Pyrococcus kukulkanii]|uniref:Uncharacterized protein n=1 Tax=Pyrococcus kukulkanii TaxID=1609559 RepID=A0ABV4T6G7_9EURY
MKRLLLIFLIMIMTTPVLGGNGWYNAAPADNNSNVTVLANLTVNTTLELANKTKEVAKEAKEKIVNITEKFKRKETIEWELFDKTKFSEYYVPVRNQSFFVSIISKHENSKIAIAYSENTRFLYENIYLTIINRNQSNLTLKFVTDEDMKEFETNSEFLMMKIKLSDEVNKLSFYVLEGNKTLFSFENITILHRTYESYIQEESKKTIKLELTSYYGRAFGYLLTGIALAFGANIFWYRRMKKRKEEEIIGGWLP